MPSNHFRRAPSNNAVSFNSMAGNNSNQPDWEGFQSTSKGPLPAISKKPLKPGQIEKRSAKDIQRDKVLRQAQLFHTKQMKALLPDPEEVKKQEQMKLRDSKMKDNVREILDMMMPQVVTEVSLKLGGAMYAQENAIKNIVDDYIRQNPVIEDRNNKMHNQLKDYLIKEVTIAAQNMEREIPGNVMKIIENESLSIFRNEMENLDTRIDTCRKGLNSSKNIQERHDDLIDDINLKISQLNTDLAVSCGTVKTSGEEFSKNYADQQINALREKLKKVDKKLHSDHNHLKEGATKQVDLESKIEANQALIEAMQKDITQLKGQCCTIM